MNPVILSSYVTPHHIHKYFVSDITGWSGHAETIVCYQPDCYPSLDRMTYPPDRIGPKLYLREAATEVM